VGQVQGTAMGQMFGEQGPAKVGVRRAPKAAPKVFTIQVINGSTVSEEKFRSPEAKQ
jgi:hypothetical protein